MAEAQSDTRISYPYMTAAQWFAVRAKLRQSVPKSIDIDWLMSALGTSEKGARNILPQLRAVGLVNPDGTSSDLAMDLRDDDSYAAACSRILNSVYPDALRNAYDDPTDDPAKVASWFMRNARTGQATANMQSRLYLTLLKGELPSEDAKPRSSRKRGAKHVSAPSESNGRQAKQAPVTRESSKSDASGSPDANAGAKAAKMSGGPVLHIDLQIHIAADASDAQIDSVFKSMAKHLYGRE